MIKYSVDILECEILEWTSVALFSNIADFTAIREFCFYQFMAGPCEDARIMDLDTGEIVWNAVDAIEHDYDMG